MITNIPHREFPQIYSSVKISNDFCALLTPISFIVIAITCGIFGFCFTPIMLHPSRSNFPLLPSALNHKINPPKFNGSKTYFEHIANNSIAFHSYAHESRTRICLVNISHKDILHDDLIPQHKYSSTLSLLNYFGLVEKPIRQCGKSLSTHRIYLRSINM